MVDRQAVLHQPIATDEDGAMRRRRRDRDSGRHGRRDRRHAGAPRAPRIGGGEQRRFHRADDRDAIRDAQHLPLRMPQRPAFVAQQQPGRQARGEQAAQRRGHHGLDIAKRQRQGMRQDLVEAAGHQVLEIDDNPEIGPRMPQPPEQQQGADTIRIDDIAPPGVPQDIPPAIRRREDRALQRQGPAAQKAEDEGPGGARQPSRPRLLEDIPQPRLRHRAERRQRPRTARQI